MNIIAAFIVMYVNMYYFHMLCAKIVQMFVINCDGLFNSNKFITVLNFNIQMNGNQWHAPILLGILVAN